MKRTLLSLAAAVAIAVPTVALACKGKDNVVKLSVPEAKDLRDKKAATFVDANGLETRNKQGVIPGAILLTSYAEFDAKELGVEKSEKLLFYCANTQCGASHMAAKRAMEQGYMNVGVLTDGIKGWKDAGLPTQKVSTPSKAAS